VHPHILYKHKLLFWMRLIAINRLTALIFNMICMEFYRLWYYGQWVCHLRLRLS